MLERLEAALLLARLFELRRVDLAHPLHRAGRAPGPLPLADDRLDVAEAEAHLLELADPADADERLGAVEAEAPLRAGGGREETELFVEVDGADGLAGFAREVAHLE